MYFYCLRAVKNYKDIFQFMYITEIECFDSHLYFYYINNGINPLIIAVDLSRVPPIVAKGQSHIKLPEEL